MLTLIKSLLGKNEPKSMGGCCGGQAKKAEEIKAAGGSCCGGSGQHAGHDHHAPHAHAHQQEEDHGATGGGCWGGHHKH